MRLNLPIQVLDVYMEKPIFQCLREEMKNELKGLVVMACGPVMTVRQSFECVKGLVAR